ncbi:MAG: pseudouridine synthase [Gammaproteobacteria bacterium]|nr:pseudouridine synthase [Gammaproteobacteria bacterium]
MRLDRLISNSTALSRSETRLAIRAQRVRVNGITATSASMALGDADSVTLDGQPVAPVRPRYFMLHKPAGCVSATVDAAHPTALDLLRGEPRHTELQIAGRLDMDTTGLLLLTDDGEWNHRLTSPAHRCDKTYRVRLRDPITAGAAARLESGILLRGEKRETRPAVVEVTGRECRREVLLTISEGKYHQVKRMFAATGNLVVGLHREQISGITLDPALAPGEYRPLTPAEVGSIS